MNEIYYQDTKDFTFKEYSFLDSYFERVLLSLNEKWRTCQYDYIKELQSLDVSKIPLEIKALLKSHIDYHNLWNNIPKNLKPLKEIKPLKKPIYISEDPWYNPKFKVFFDMNIIV